MCAGEKAGSPGGRSQPGVGAVGWGSPRAPTPPLARGLPQGRARLIPSAFPASRPGLAQSRCSGKHRGLLSETRALKKWCEDKLSDPVFPILSVRKQETQWARWAAGTLPGCPTPLSRTMRCLWFGACRWTSDSTVSLLKAISSMAGAGDGNHGLGSPPTVGQQHLRGESKSSGQQVPEGNSVNDPSQAAESSLFNPLNSS